MIKIKAGKIKVSGYGLIIDKDGMPCIKNPLDVPDQVWSGLSREQKAHSNLKVEEHYRRFD